MLIVNADLLSPTALSEKIKLLKGEAAQCKAALTGGIIKGSEGNWVVNGDAALGGIYENRLHIDLDVHSASVDLEISLTLKIRWKISWTRFPKTLTPTWTQAR